MEIHSSRSTLSQINITPFVDVMLVLLIIFMVTAPMMETGLDISIPEVKDAQQLTDKETSITVSIDKSGNIQVGKTKISSTTKLAAFVSETLKADNGKSFHIEADKDTPYGLVVKALASMRSAGASKIGLITLPDNE